MEEFKKITQEDIMTLKFAGNKYEDMLNLLSEFQEPVIEPAIINLDGSEYCVGGGTEGIYDIHYYTYYDKDKLKYYSLIHRGGKKPVEIFSDGISTYTILYDKGRRVLLKSNVVNKNVEKFSICSFKDGNVISYEQKSQDCGILVSLNYPINDFFYPDKVDQYLSFHRNDPAKTIGVAINKTALKVISYRDYSLFRYNGEMYDLCSYFFKSIKYDSSKSLSVSDMNDMLKQIEFNTKIPENISSIYFGNNPEYVKTKKLIDIHQRYSL